MTVKVKVRFKKRTERVIRAIESPEVKSIIESLNSKQELTEEQLKFAREHSRMLGNAFAFHRLPFKLTRLSSTSVIIEAGYSRGSNIPGIVRDQVASVGVDSSKLTNRALRRKIAAHGVVDAKPTVYVPSSVSEADIQAFYESWDWKRLRYRALQRHGRKCLSCNVAASDGARIVVDHIKPIRHHWHLRLDPENVQPLCDDCNMGKGSWDETDFRRITVS